MYVFINTFIFCRLRSNDKQLRPPPVQQSQLGFLQYAPHCPRVGGKQRSFQSSWTERAEQCLKVQSVVLEKDSHGCLLEGMSAQRSLAGCCLSALTKVILSYAGNIKSKIQQHRLQQPILQQRTGSVDTCYSWYRYSTRPPLGFIKRIQTSCLESTVFHKEAVSDYPNRI